MPMNRETFGPQEWSFGWEYLMDARADGSACETAAPQFDGRARVVIEGVRPEIDGGQFPIKRVIGEYVAVEADVFADGHEWISCEILYRAEGEPRWRSKPMRSIGNDRWRADFQVTELGLYRYSLQGWIDPFKTWRDDLAKRHNARQDLAIHLLAGAALLEDAAARTSGSDSTKFAEWARLLRQQGGLESKIALALSEEVAALMDRYPARRFAKQYDKQLKVVVERDKALFSAWYEVFPRSCAAEPGRHGAFKDCEAWLPYIASMGFDVLYLPPIHPIGRTFRKGKNNSPAARPEDVGSPWAIGGEEGGHTSIHPQLGTLEDFRRLVSAAQAHGLEMALDIAFQCSPDHPYTRQHPEWFRKRPDGAIQYAENPPKKYQDIYPFDFETSQWRELWAELRNVLLFWVKEGIRIFRVDNPHTKAFPFWEWVIGALKREYPDLLFLAEAFTRPRLMYRLAKLGFSQSYTYFTWRNTKQELTDYFTELTAGEIAEYFRPNLWPNTPDILPEFLQVGGRPAFMIRLILAATLGSNYGIYGGAFELCENAAAAPGSEEYLNSEKYELKHRDLNSPVSLRNLIARVNQIRRDNPALRRNRGLRFHQTDNPLVICYSKSTEDLSNVVLTVVNLDAFHPQASWLDLDLEPLGLDPIRPFQALDLLAEGRYLWQGRRNYVELAPQSMPACIFKLQKRVRTEKDFDYYR
ncbi:MAG TPA: alpha-1,4-glucan--maltose-1-phosphate maltosyltransferase [Bryobacteraceae bacterium]|nr:alpha-1,4-glucan--maltose-1-phosphate maltosyltransferase [Bryobacteraceae bacterium]